MTSRKIKSVIRVFAFLGFIFFIFQNSGTYRNAFVLAHGIEKNSELQKKVVAIVAAPGADVGDLPLRILIPRIRVDAAIEKVGLLPDGSMGVPKIPRDAAWFNLGPRPGNVGTAAIAGHVNWWNGASAVFANLNKLKPGDKIIIQDEKGWKTSFIVRKSRLFGSAESAEEVFNRNDGASHLALITCNGVWIKRDKQYSKRFVIFADKEMISDFTMPI
ncbi:MAG: class F sortase [Candidatus Magasanikbacteria bacterium]|nr:class F sortase [Candidatus Magasanikbacteria bacterium]